MPIEIPARRVHLARLRSIWRSAGWPCRDAVELDLVAAGWAFLQQGADGHETIRLTDLGIRLLAEDRQRNLRSSSLHDRLAARVATQLMSAGRIVWRELSLRARIQAADPPSSGDDASADALMWPEDGSVLPRPSQGGGAWRMARPDVFSLRRTSVEDYLQPMVHEVKVSRADLLCDLRHAAKRESYQWLSCETCYVLPAGVAEPHELPEELGVWLLHGSVDTGVLELVRPARHTPCKLPFAVWMALAKATPCAADDEARQQELKDAAPEDLGVAGARERLAGHWEGRLKTYTVAVRILCEFAAKQGDLDLRFTPSPTSQQGISGHRTVAASRSASYRSELRLSGQYRHLVVRGRADGYDPDRQLLEEVKTYVGELDLMPANHRHLHWAQAKIYGALACREFQLAGLTVSLVYFDVGRQQEAPPLSQHCTAIELQAFFEALCERFIAWADAELAHRERRDAALGSLKFPHAEFRAGQRDLAKAVFNAARLGRCLLAQAPTGIGKTMATLFPMLKACPGQELDKVFFLTAKGSGRSLALTALETLRRSAPGMPLRVVELLAREKSCEQPDKACHGESCPLARGFYDRLPAARAAAASAEVMTRESLREVALSHVVCPYYLGQEMARWGDVIVADYNHYFDGSALLHALTLANGWRVGVLVDEAHNLVDRARAMYTARLDAAQLRSVRASAPDALKRPLDRLRRSWTRLNGEAPGAYTVFDEPPRAFASALQEVVGAMSEVLAHQGKGAERADGALLEFYFEALALTRLIESFDSHSIFDVTREPGRTGGSRSSGLSVCVRNVLPAPFLKPRFAAARSTVLFSATLAPWHFYGDTLGLPDDTAWLDVAAPFSPEQLSVRIAGDISTRYRHRSRSLAPIARLIAAQYEEAPGNYIAFFSSFDYLEKALEELAARYPGIPTWRQSRRMVEIERDAFVARFAIGGCGVGFAVLGGSFAEGIDLVGERLVGVFIATLGLPQVNPVNEELRRRLDGEFGAGDDYVYLFPGIRKVVQAAGRVIRTPSDRGVLHLIDDRFARPEVRRLLPGWWRFEDG